MNIVFNSYKPINIQNLNIVVLLLNLLLSLIIVINVNVIIIVAVFIISHFKPKFITLKVMKERVRLIALHEKSA